MNNNLTKSSKDELLGVRCICVVGIILAHSYVPGLFETGGMWRVPILFLIGGFALIKKRPLHKTVLYVTKDFYLYTCFVSILYMMALYWIYDGGANKFISEYKVSSVFLQDVFIHNNHKNTLILGSWFLIPYGISLIILSIIMVIINKIRYSQIPFAFGLILISLMLVRTDSNPWLPRLISQISFTSAMMLIGHFIFTNSFAHQIIRNGWVIILSLTTALWLSTAFNWFYIVWSWMIGTGEYWLAYPSAILFTPSILWLGRKISSSKVVKYVGSKSKDIMIHHIFGFMMVNIILVHFELTELDKIDALYVFNGEMLWPAYFFSAIAWSLIAAKISEKIKVFLGDCVAICKHQMAKNMRF